MRSQGCHSNSLSRTQKENCGAAITFPPPAGVALPARLPVSYSIGGLWILCARKALQKRPGGMHVFVSASTECFRDLSLVKAMERLADLEYTAVEFAMFEDGDQLKPSQVAADVETAIALCRNSRRLDVVAFDVR